jgi:hypothetical protein
MILKFSASIQVLCTWNLLLKANPPSKHAKTKLKNKMVFSLYIGQNLQRVFNFKQCLNTE